MEPTQGEADTVALLKSIFAHFQVLTVDNKKQYQEESIKSLSCWSFEAGNQYDQWQLNLISALLNLEL